MSAEFMFMSLPPELRDMVWRFTLPGPQIHKAVETSLSGCLHFKTHIISPEPPVALSVCRESRDAAHQVLTPFPRCLCFKNRPCIGRNRSRKSNKCPDSCWCQQHGKIGYFNRKLDTLHIDLWNPSPDWDASWADFTRISVAAHYPEKYYQDLPTLLGSRSCVSQIYLTILRPDKRMREIAARKRMFTELDLTVIDIPDDFDDLRDPSLLLDRTQCVSLRDLEVVKSEKNISGQRKFLEQFRAREKTAAQLVEDFGKDRNLKVDVAVARILCTCP